jgi:HTH-type transcriptional regulator, glycine betaine synthesis regulator
MNELRMSAASGSKEHAASLARWEQMAIDAVGDVIEFWGFKRNQGRVWALLYLRGQGLTAAEIERILDLSKGAVSMLIRDLDRWRVIRRERSSSDPAWRYRAETELIRMVTRVVEQREGEFISRVRSEIAEARRLAAESGDVSEERMARLDKMNSLADHTERALRLFVRTARLDVGGMFEVFREGSRALRRRQ